MLRKLRDIVTKKITLAVLFVSLILNLKYFKESKHLNKKADMKFILLWKPKNIAPFEALEKGNTAFVRKKCTFKNCFITNDVNVFTNVSDFDAILFDVLSFKSPLPKNRSPHQKYIFGAMESASYNPVCNKIFDGFFNWTWTYKLDSNFRWGYFTIYDLAGNIVGPTVNLKWPKLKPTSEEVIAKLNNKSRAAAWLVSHCNSRSNREKFVVEVQKELKKFGLDVDVFGKCGPFKCPKAMKHKCFNLIQEKYYFYFSFENSFAEDYVTEKVMTALDNYAIPVVFGGADYSRFLPPGSYLDGLKLGAHGLAVQMNMIINNKSFYYEFFRWRNHFKYKETGYDDDVCKLCSVMNDDKLMQYSNWKKFSFWWNGNRHREICNNK